MNKTFVTIKNLRNFLFGGLLCVWALVSHGQGMSVPPVPAQQQISAVAARKNILILYSYGHGGKGVGIFDEGFLAVISAAGISVNNLYAEYLDLQRFEADPGYPARLCDLLLRKYSEHKIDLIVTVQQPALKYLLSFGKPLAPGAPVITVQAPQPAPAETQGRRFLCMLTQFDIQGTLARALELFPQTTRVVFVSGSSEADKAMAAAAARVAASWQGKLEFEYTSDLTIERLLQRVANLPRNVVIIFTQYNRDTSGRVTLAYEVEKMIVSAANAPVFGLYDFNLRNGGIGGSVVSVKDLGETTGKRAVEIFNGKLQLLQPVTPVNLDVVPIFDWRQIVRWGGDASRLPLQSHFLNRPPSLWQQYRRQVIAAVIVFLVQSLLIIALLVQKRRRSLAEAALRESEQSFRVLMEQAPEAIVVFDMDRNRLVDANVNAERVFGCSRGELMQSGLLRFYEAEQPDKRNPEESFREHHHRALQGEEVIFERAICGANGHHILCEVRVVALPAKGKRLFRGSFIDITERKKMQEKLRDSEAQFRSLIQLAPVPIAVYGARGEMEYLNDRFTATFGYSIKDIPNLEAWWTRAYPDESYRREVLTAWGQMVAEAARENGDIQPKEYRVARKDSEFVVVEIRGRQIGGKNLVLLNDLTERNRAQEAVRAALHEKESLLKEIHHRVKNNLQIIVSLLRLQSDQIENLVAKAALQDMKNRVRSMALIHEHLYQSENLAQVDLATYIQSLCQQLVRALVARPGDIQLHLDLVPLRLELDQAIPCGLLVNELVSNALKHAFPQGRTGEVRVELRQEDGSQQMRLRVSDNGVGLPAGFDLKRLSSLGMQLVTDLIRKLRGQLKIGPGPGATFEVVFTAANGVDSHGKPGDMDLKEKNE